MGPRVSLCYPGVDPAPWIDGLRALLPNATLSVWEAGAEPADYGVVWAPPQQLSAHVFWRHPRIRVTPHISAQTLQSDSLAQIAAKIRALEQGQSVAGIVDLKHGY